MLTSNLLGTAPRSRTALAIITATLLIGGTATGASAKSRHDHSHARKDNGAKAGSSQRSNTATPAVGTGHTFNGMASFYGNESGSQTASGQRFNQNALTAAHRSLPFGTKLRVTHHGRSVVVTINDRGPFIRGRVLDLSTGAARAIGLTSAGVGHVTAEVIS